MSLLILLDNATLPGSLPTWSEVLGTAGLSWGERIGSVATFGELVAELTTYAEVVGTIGTPIEVTGTSTTWGEVV